jgi:hypothetical protein
MPPLSSRAQFTIRHAHARQLAQMQIPNANDISSEIPPLGFLESTIDWIKANSGALKAAQETRTL